MSNQQPPFNPYMFPYQLPYPHPYMNPMMPMNPNQRNNPTPFNNDFYPPPPMPMPPFFYPPFPGMFPPGGEQFFPFPDPRIPHKGSEFLYPHGNNKEPTLINQESKKRNIGNDNFADKD